MIHSTIRPVTVRKIATESARRSIGVVDAPVSGGPRGAQLRTMCYMVGGDKELVERCRPVFETSAKSIFHVGPLGSGMTAKLAHQVIICLNVLAAREGMALAAKAGLDLTMMQEVVRAGGAQSRVADNWIKKQADSERIQVMVQGSHAGARVRRRTRTRVTGNIDGARIDRVK